LIGTYAARPGSGDGIPLALLSDPSLRIERATDHVALWCDRNLTHAHLASVPADADRPAVACAMLGAIFDREALRREIARRTPSTPGPEDPAHLVAQAYRHLGPGFLDDLDGEYVLVLHDAGADRLLVHTDRCAVQRLFTHADDTRYAACTDLGRLVHLIGPGAVDAAAVRDYFCLGYLPAPHTAFDHIRKSTPALRQCWRLDAWQFADLPPAVRPEEEDGGNGSVDDPPGAMLDCLRACIARRVEGTAAPAVLLTSGFDSTLNAALLREHGDDVACYTIGFSDRVVNENDNARRIARHHGARHHDLMLSTDQLLDSLVDWVHRHHEPWSHQNGLSTYVAFGLLRDAGVAGPVLDGSGGDFLFRDFANEAGKLRAARRMAPVPGPLKDLLYRLTPGRPRSRIGRFMAHLDRVGQHGPTGTLVFHNFWKVAYFERLTGGPFDFARTAPGQAMAAGGEDPLARFLAYYASWGFDASVGRSVMESNLQGLRVTYPYEDPRLIALVTGLNLRRGRTGDRPRFLQDAAALRLVPARFFAPRKMAMETPIAAILQSTRGLDLLHHYLTGPDAAADDTYDSAFAGRILAEFSAGRIDHAERLWNLLIYEIWRRNVADQPV